MSLDMFLCFQKLNKGLGIGTEGKKTANILKKKKPRVINKRKGKYTCSKCKEKGMVIISENREFQAKIQH